MKIECGIAVNTHGITGELKVRSFCDDGFFGRIRAVYADGVRYGVTGVRTHAGHVLLRLEGIKDMTAAEKLKGKTLFAEREDIDMPEGRVFYSEIVGFSVFDERFGRVTGSVAGVSEAPSGILLEIKTEKGTMLLPDIPQFVLSKSLKDKTVTVRTIEGSYPDED